MLGAPRVGVTRGLLGWSLMPKNLKRYNGRGDLHFVTFSCYRRPPLLRTIRARNLFMRALGAIHERYKFLLVGYVVMPDHCASVDQRAPEVDTLGDVEGTQTAGFPGFECLQHHRGCRLRGLADQQMHNDQA